MNWKKEDFPIINKIIPNTVMDSLLEKGNEMLNRGENEVGTVEQYLDNIRHRTRNLASETAEGSAEVMEEVAERSEGTLRSASYQAASKAREQAHELEEDAVYVARHPQGWAVQTIGDNQTTATYADKQLAIDEARRIANRKGVALIVKDEHRETERAFEKAEENVQKAADRTQAAVRKADMEAQKAAKAVEAKGAEITENLTQGDGQIVEPHAEGWAVRTAGAQRATKVFPTKEEALERGREIAQAKGVTLTVLRQDGSVQHTLYKD